MKNEIKKQIQYTLLIFLFGMTVLSAQSQNRSGLCEPFDRKPIIMRFMARARDGGGTMPCVGTPLYDQFCGPDTENKISEIALFLTRTILFYRVSGIRTKNLLSGWGDYGYCIVMPQVWGIKLLPKDRALALHPIRREFRNPTITSCFHG